MAFERTGPPAGNATVVRFAVVDVESTTHAALVAEEIVEEELVALPEDERESWYEVALRGPQTNAVVGRWEQWAEMSETESEDLVVQRRLRDAIGGRDPSKLRVIVMETVGG